MWNKTACNAGKERDREPFAETPAVASSLEGLGHHLGVKRQRRPSVRLEEISDRPAAGAAEKKTKKLGFLVASANSRPKVSDNVSPLETDGAQESDVVTSFKSGKGFRTRPLVHANNGTFHEHSASDDDGGNGETHAAARQSDLASPFRGTPVEGWAVLQSTLHNTDVAKPAPKLFKCISKKVRNGNRKREGSKAAASVKQLSSSAPSGILLDTEEVPCMQDDQCMHSNEGNDVRTPEGFRDCDLETSDHLNDVKDMSNSQGIIALRGCHMSLMETRETLRTFEVGSPKQGQDFVERDKNKSLSQQVSEEGLSRKGKALEPRYDAETPILTQVNRQPPDNKVKSLVEASETQQSREQNSEYTQPHFARHNPSLLNGVEGWLQNLGLCQYARHFEAHEVDADVLPLLTLDDLKEMGISVVGSRRKMFYAIQQLGKCPLVDAE